MDMSLEIQPDQYTIVVGPKFAAQVVRELSGDDDIRLPVFEFKNIVDRGVSYLLEKESFANSSEKAKFEARYNNAYELDPVFVIRKVMTSLQIGGCYKDWLAELFTCNPPTKKSSISLQHLYALQARGALIVYVHCDDIITRAAGLEPVLLQNEQQIDRWANGECAGILQLHGVYSDPNSVQLDCQLYESNTHPLNSALKKLKQFLSRRNTVLLGDDWDELSKDPLLGRFYKECISEESTNENSFVFHTVKAALRGLSLCGSTPIPTIYPITNNSAALWKQIDVVSMPFSQPCQYKLVCLLVSSQTGARDISHMMVNAPGVNFALVNTVTYEKTSIYCVSLRVTSESLHQLWNWLLTSSCESLLSSDLHGIAMQGGTFLWLKDPATINQGADHHESETDMCEGSLSEISKCNSVTSQQSDTSKDTRSPGPYPITTTISHSFSPPSNHNIINSGDSNSEVRHNKPIIQRYKVVKKRNQLIGGSANSSGGVGTDTGLYGGAYFMSKTYEETGMTFHNAQHLNKYARRGSLPPIKCGEAGNTLALFAERLQPPHDGAPFSTSSQIPSYVAIKRALLSDKFKHVQNPITRLVAPKMLLNLLQSKKQSFIPDERSSILAHRRNSDPGSYLQHRDKARRRQLFRDENMQWIKTHGPVIDKKIQAWKQKRLLKMQREYFYSQQREKLGLCHQQELQFMNSAKLIQSNSLYASLTSSSTATPPTSLASLTQAFVAAAGTGVSGFSPSPLMYQLPSAAGITPTPVLLPAPFVSPYAFMGSYATIPATVATPPAATTYIMPAGALTAPAGAQQRVMFLPTTSTTGNPTLMTTVSNLTSHTKPPFSSLLAPTTDTPEQKHTPDLVSNILASRKRKHSIPEKLSSLLQPSSDLSVDSDMSPPSEKRHHTASESDNERHHSESPPPLHSHTDTTSLSHSSHHHHRHRHRHSRHHHQYTHHSSSHSHHSHHTSSHYHHSSTTSSHHTHKPSSPLEQCLLQIPSPISGDKDSNSPVPSPTTADYSSHPTPQLWQFLLELLLTTDCSHLIEWTNTKQDDEYEFIIHDPVKVAQLWGKYTNNSNMNYDKLARGLCHYYSKGIIEKVDGKKLTFRYNGLARSYVQKRCSQTVDVTNSLEEMVVVE